MVIPLFQHFNLPVFFWRDASEAQRSLRPFGLLMLLLLIGLLWAVVPAKGQSFKLVSFTKSTGGAPGRWVEVGE
jgi:hypothetical protein